MKNIKPLAGKPLLHYTIDIARRLAVDEDICLSTDSEEIIRLAESYGLPVPFVRPAELATDTSGSREAILHALDFYNKRGKMYENVVLLQPTSPFRKASDLSEMIKLFDSTIDMIVSVKESHENPYFSLFEEESGFLKLSKESSFVRRQDCPKVYAYNGSVYVINAKSVYERNLHVFKRVKKYVMDDIHSIDIDTHFDWLVAEMIIEKGLFGASVN